MTTELSHQDFLENLQSEYLIKAETAPIKLTLVEVSERKYAPGHEQFSIVLRGSNDSALGQGVFQVEHATMGAFELFIVPISADQQGTYYEAIFNRLPKE